MQRFFTENNRNGRKIEKSEQTSIYGKIEKTHSQSQTFIHKSVTKPHYSADRLSQTLKEQIIKVIESDPFIHKNEKFPTSFYQAKIPPPPKNKNKWNYRPMLIGYPAVKSTNEVLANEMHQCISKKSLSQECEDGSI